MKPEAFDTPVIRHTARSPRPRSSSGRGALDLYLDRAGRYPRLTADEERAQLVRLVELRRRRWEALLSEPSAHAAVLRAVESQLEPRSTERLDEARRQARTLRRGDTQSARRAFDRSNAALAVELEALDLDGQLAESLISDPPVSASSSDEAERYRRRIRRAATAYRRARNDFLCANLRLVLRVAERFSGRWMSLADRVQDGNLGLIKAVERFDPEHGTRFSTYAVWWIRHTITRALVNRGRAIRIPANLHQIFNRVRRARAALSAQRGRSVTLEEIAEHIEVPLHRVEAAVDALELRAVPLDGAPPEDGAAPRRAEALGFEAPQGSIDDDLDRRRAAALARRTMEQLAPRERDILERRFALGGHSRVTLEALGRLHHVSRERVRQLQNRALRTLRREVESSPIGCLAYA